MDPDKRNIPEGNNLQHRRRFELFFFEQVGSRTYLRFTNLALVLVLVLTVGAMAMIIALFLWNSNHEPEETDVNIRPAAQAPTNYNSPLIQPKPIPPPKVVQGPLPVPGAPNPLTTPTPAANDNRVPARSPSPSLTPSLSPIRTPT